MLTRFVTSLNHRFGPVSAIILALTLGLASAGTAQETRTLTLPEARAMAIEALRIGEPTLTLQLATGLLQADPKDPFTHYLMAHAHGLRDEPQAARKSAARAYRFADPGPDRFEAAQMAARYAFDAQQHMRAQFWLRRSAIHARDEEVEKVVARDFRAVRAQNPWALRVRGDLRPSSNVNNGADTALQIIDGVPVTGTLSGAAQALSGLIATFDVATTYRLNATPTSATSLGGRFYATRVALSDAARDLAPTARNSDYATAYLELSARHAFAVGPADKRGTAYVDLATGRAWSGDSSSYSFARLSGERGWRLAGGRYVSLTALAEDRFDARYASNAAKVFGFGAYFVQPLRNGDQLSLTLAYRDTNAEQFNGTFSATSLRTSYTFGQPVGPVQVSAGLVLGYADYPTYQSGLFLVPGGRQDKSIYGDVNLMFNDLDYAGFAPILRLRAGQKSSNDSRFDINELSISLGIESKF